MLIVRLLPAFLVSAALAGDLPKFHAPETADAVDYSPRMAAWEEPNLPRLPTDEALKTVEIRNRTFHITRVSPRAYLKTDEEKAKAGTEGLAIFDKEDEAVFLRGSGGGGLNSKERLIVDGCTFLIDFEEGNFEVWDPRRSAIFVDGYREVIIRNCVFLSLARPEDPLRKVAASVYITDSVKVQVEDCYFEGRTIGWRGHLTIFCCGPTSIRNVEVNGLDRPAGGLWVATGVGEGKLGWMHQDAPERMIYPPGPLLIENCWIHDQKGKENSDGIYIQSVRPYLVRNCKVEDWGPDDSLIDVGFRDTPAHTYNGKPLIQHGGVGVVERCEFARGYVKDSVGLGGALVFRNNVMRDGAWFFPYAFDGGQWFVLSNDFRDMTGVIVSGRNNQLDGWTPKEGMLTNGSRMHLFNNRFAAKEGATLKALYVAGADPWDLKRMIVSDYNAYAMETPPALWGIEPLGEIKYATVDDWRTATGNDKNSLMGAVANTAAFAKVEGSTVALPKGLAMKFGEFEAGLTGPVGIRSADTAKRAVEISTRISEEYAGKNFLLQAEDLTAGAGAGEAKRENRTWASGGAYLVIRPSAPGAEAAFEGKIASAGRFAISTATVGSKQPGMFQFLLNSKPLGEPFDGAKRRNVFHGVTNLAAGAQTFAYKLVSAGPGDGTELTLDAVVFSDGEAHDRESARSAKAAGEAEAAKQRRAAIEAQKLRFSIEEIPLVGSAPGHYSFAEVKGTKYRLFQPTKSPAVLPYDVPIPPGGGRYRVSARFFQQKDKANIQLSINETPVGEAVPVKGESILGEVDLKDGPQRFTLTFTDFLPNAKIRIEGIDLLPADSTPTPQP